MLPQGPRTGEGASLSLVAVYGAGPPGRDRLMKKILELILCVLHPVAVILIWVTLPFKSNPRGVVPKLAWGLACIVPFVPFLYVLTDHDFL
jgi:hypothetical protein